MLGQMIQKHRAEWCDTCSCGNKDRPMPWMPEREKTPSLAHLHFISGLEVEQILGHNSVDHTIEAKRKPVSVAWRCDRVRASNHPSVSLFSHPNKLPRRKLK